MADTLFLGIDLGSVSLDAVAVDERGDTVWSTYRRVRGRSREGVADLCRDLLAEVLGPRGLDRFGGAMAAGSGKEIVAELLGVDVVNEIVAHGTAAGRLAGGKASVVEIGGQDSKFIQVDENGPFDYSMNELCAAGTGAFLDVQAERLGLSIEEFSRLAAGARRVPPVAGRCSVFAKSDITHLQQRGTPVDEIAAGLCFALARNYIATLIRGREVLRPVVMQGGVALNDGVARAFRELLGLKEGELVRPARPDLMGAIGAALLARERPEPLLASAVAKAAEAPRSTAPVRTLQKASADAASRSPLEEYELGEPVSGRLFMGIDVGSVSTDVVLADEAGRIAGHVYTLTSGKPLDAVRRAFAFLGEHFPAARVAGVATTGSGRRLAGHLVGADLVIDEITAQARGAHAALPDADTVLEIGGQDAKFIRLDSQGFVREFEMNRACSAGTGSFLQEQSVRLGIDLRADFARLALTASEPLPLANRCTVFMESDLVHHVQQGASLPGILQGLAAAVVDNYLDRVARGRKPGRKIVMQGGVARNAAVVDAFRRRLAPATVEVHPTPGLSGALGAALLAAAQARESKAPTGFKGFDVRADFKATSFGCRYCENRCEVDVFEAAGGKFYFGDLCGRYAEAMQGGHAGHDHTELRETMVRALVRSATGSQSIGVPEALLFREYFPFWFAFFGRLDVKVVTSGPTGSTKLHAGLARLPAETCLPVKLLFGHVAELGKEGVRRVLLPSMELMHDGQPCPYVQHAAGMISAVFRDVEVFSWPLLPGLKGREREALLEKIGKALGKGEDELLAAYLEAEDSFRLSQKLAEVPLPDDRPVAVILGKPYNSGDRFINLALSSKLARAGFDVVLSSQLGDLSETPLPPGYDCITWEFSRRMLRAAIELNRRPNLFPVVVGNFGCGPDSFTLPLLEEEFGERPSLFLELDEHRADAGLDTRVEAFAHRAFRWFAAEQARRRAGLDEPRTEAPAAPPQEPAAEAPEGKEASGSGSVRDRVLEIGAMLGLTRQSQPAGPQTEYLIPYFSDHAFAFAGALRGEGAQARVLPLPTREVAEAGIEVSGGKQCDPFQYVAGDIVRLAKSGELPRNATYLFPVSGGSCLITQYVPAIRRYLDQLGRSDVAVMGTSSAEIAGRFGASFLLNLGRGIAAIEYLLRLRYELRPYAVRRGAVEEVYPLALSAVAEAQARGKVEEALHHAVALLRQVETRGRGTRPVIGIAGDVYTRVNPAANGNLFDLLEELGCEVWLPPTLVDVALARSSATSRIPRYKELWETTTSWAASMVKTIELSNVQKHFKGLLRNLEEPDNALVEQNVRGIIPETSDVLYTLNVSKHVDFARKRVDGILNVFCLNCMVGTSTAAVYPALKERTGGIPMMSLVFDGLGTTHTRNRIEAFVHRVERAKRGGAVARAADSEKAAP